MAEKELALINKVELRIALADTDEKFQSSLDLYLAPLLLKLASEHQEVRNEILKFLQHLITRIKSAPKVKLPILKLINQARNPSLPQSSNNALTVKLYSVLMATKGVERISPGEALEILPSVVNQIHSLPSGVKSRIFHLFIKLIQIIDVPDRGTQEFFDLRKRLEISIEDELFLCGKIEKMFLLQPVINNDGVIPRGYTCPGLSAVDVGFLTYDAGVSYKGNDLSIAKKKASNFIKLFDDINLLSIILIGSLDSNEEVANNCAAFLRKVKIPYEEEKIVNHLIDLYVGDKTVPRSPVKQIVQERIMQQFLLQSKLATNSDKIPIISSIGLNASRFPKLKSATIQFIQWVAQNTESHSLSSEEYSFNVASQIRNNLHSEGWPQIQISQGLNFANEMKNRRLQYEALGDILKKNGNLVRDLSYIEFLFDSLVGDIRDVRSTIQDALSSVIIHLSNIPSTSKNKLKTLLKRFLRDEFRADDSDAVASTRYIALKYINAAFPFSDPEARFLNILGTSSKNRSDVIEEAQKGIHPHWFKILQFSNTKDFKSTAELLGGASQPLQFPTFRDYYDQLAIEIDYAMERDTSSLHYSLGNALDFGLKILVSEAISEKSTVIIQDQEWETRLEKGLEHDPTVINLTKIRLAKAAKEQDGDDSLFRFLQLLIVEFVANSNGELSTINQNPKELTLYGKTLTRTISLSPSVIISKLVQFIPLLLSILDNGKTIKDDVIHYGSSVIGIIASHPDVSDDSVVSILSSIIVNYDQDSKQIGNPRRVLTLSYLTSRLFVRQRFRTLTHELTERIYSIINEALKASDIKTSDIGVLAVSQLAKFGGYGPSISNGLIGNLDFYRGEIVETLKQKVKKSNEKAVIALALFSLHDSESTEDGLTDLETAIFDTYNTKQVELLFTSGEAFSILASGWDSKFLQQQVDIQDDLVKINTAPREERLKVILGKILNACNSSKPSLRKAGCIWLLSLAQYCGGSPILADNSSTIHITFMKFLADRDEIVQEAASRGLSIIYELGDNDLKETLVKSLLRSFTDSASASKLSSGSVSEDTELFQPGVLKTDDGSISTYKDILNLASEVGDPSLVYKFMSLAKSSALWSSRKGIAFGLGNIMSKSSLDKLLVENKTLAKRLIPKLYRYKFDPNPSVARSMNDIWVTLISDSSGTIDLYHESILNELLTGMGNKEWRVREASTYALTELLQILRTDKYDERIEEIWSMGFRVLDDIKESVRKAGGGLTRSLSQTLISTISIESGSSASNAQRVLARLLPFLLGSKGISSDAEDVTNFALQTILTLVKKSGKAIKPFVGELMEQFILLMSTLEPQVLNYLTLNADKYNVKSDDIDARRLQNVGSSPMMDALEKLIDLVDDSIAGEVVSKLQSSVKKAVGLPSKAASSRVIVALVIRHLQLMKSYGDSLLNVCISQLKDRNTTISSSFAAAAGYACRVSSIETVVKYAKKIQALYFESDQEERARLVAGIASESVSKYSGDVFAAVAVEFLPIAFIAKNDPVKDVAKPFELEWSENTSGNGAVKLYIHEICEIVKTNIGSPQFFIRQIVAKSIATACNSIDGTISEKTSNELFEVLINACQGRSWNGKEDILAALVSLSLKSKLYFETHQEVLAKIKKIVIIEGKRRNKEYQKHAVVSLGRFAEGFPSDDLYDSIIEIFSTLLSEDYYESDDEVEESEKRDIEQTVNVKSSRKNLAKEADRIAFLLSLSSSFQLYESGEYHDEVLNFILKSLVNTIDPKVYIPTWRSQLSTVEGFSKIVNVLKDARLLTDQLLKGLSDSWIEIYKSNTTSQDVENVRVQTVRLGKLLIKLRNERLTSQVQADLLELESKESSTIVKVEIENALS
ncbi:hypothetical protein WICMUC_003256 [Wickerhamomyces mucosus]|uniref:Proteasome component ECM29 n=1 Tax=Wickerhamomyces mucosus TaxID=1378264 RepID=A0A9P8TD71_9ASCO|nr:hypothetical protein WICMUC_003256 [Wickerhamomyces mucosus]